MPIKYIDLDGCEPAEPESKWNRKTEYENQEGRTGEYYSTSDGYYVHKNGDTYNWAKVGDKQWNPDANWKPTDYIDKRPIGVPEQPSQTKWVDQFQTHINSMRPMLDFAASYAETAANISLAGLDGLAASGVTRCVQRVEPMITLYRGTDGYSELCIFQETGMIMSDAARTAYMETTTLAPAFEIHKKWLQIFNGDLNKYATAHALTGTEMAKQYGLERTLISWTTSSEIAKRFGKNVFQITVPHSQVFKQTLKTSTESEYLIINSVKAIEYVPK